MVKFVKKVQRMGVKVDRSPYIKKFVLTDAERTFLQPLLQNVPFELLDENKQKKTSCGR